MALTHIILNLEDSYSIKADHCDHDVEVAIFHNGTQVGGARLLSDNVDVECITHIEVADEHVNHRFSNGKNLGESLIKFLIKFPSVVRKPEFRFILNTPENLKDVVASFHFDRGEGSDLEKDIMLRAEARLPREFKIIPPNVSISTSTSIHPESLTELLDLLKKNAYWQTHLTLDRLTLLVNSAQCFVAVSEGKLIGFARVLTDGTSFASLWDVVVEEPYRGKGIGTALMYNIFSDPVLSTVKNWVIFTDTAKALYGKFGFVSESEMPDRSLVHKLRLQETHPSYMPKLIKVLEVEQSLVLNPDQSASFLFGENKARSGLSNFWRSVSTIPTVEISPVSRLEMSA